MNDVSSPALCKLPEEKPTRESFDLRPKSVEAWLSELPTANVSQTGKALFKALREVNHLKVKPAARLAFLELVRERVAYVITESRKNYKPREFPLPEGSRKSADLAIALVTEMAVGYCQIVQAHLSKTFKVKPALLQAATHRAIRYLSAVLVERYVLYEPSPNGIWRRIHALFKLAEQQRLQHNGIRDELLQFGATQTVDHAYKQTLMLAAAGPYRMRHAEAVDAYATLEAWAPYVALVKAGEAGAKEAVFQVELDRDLPPVPISAQANKHAHSRLLVTADAVKAIEQSRERRHAWWKFWKKPEPALSGMDEALVNRLMFSLGVLPKRQFNRQRYNTPVEVMVGLSHISRVLAEAHGMQMDEDNLSDASKHFHGRDLSDPRSKRTQDVWQMLYPTELLSQLRKKDKDEEDESFEAHRHHDPESMGWRLLNISAGGYCLLSDPSQTTRAQVGEIVALREVDDAHHAVWQTAAIRWMKYVPGEGLNVGLQVLAPNPMPVLTQPETAPGKFGATSRSLLLPEIIATDQPGTLLTPCLHYGENVRVMLKGFGEPSHIVLTQQLEATGAFAQFAFHAATSKRDDGEEDYSSLLSSG